MFRVTQQELKTIPRLLKKELASLILSRHLRQYLSQKKPNFCTYS